MQRVRNEEKKTSRVFLKKKQTLITEKKKYISSFIFFCFVEKKTRTHLK
jgi:hypothetical protein